MAIYWKNIFEKLKLMVLCTTHHLFFFGKLANKIKENWHCKSYLILRDSFPQWLVDQGIIKEGGLAERYFRYFEQINYDAADYIGLMSDRNKDIFINKYQNKYKVQTLFNWADFKGIDNIPSATLRSKLALQKQSNFFLWRQYWPCSGYDEFNEVG